MNFSKFRGEKLIFQSSETKNELHAEFKDKNNSLAKIILCNNPMSEYYVKDSHK
jgi:hypothetical protein